MFRKAIGVFKMSLNKSIKHPRMVLLLILLFIYMDYTLHGIRDFCSTYGVTVSTWELFAQIFSNPNVQGCLILFYAFLLADLPGTDICEQYILIRSGEVPWMVGKVITVIGLASVWMILIAVYSCLIVQKLNVSTQWSNAMITLSKTDAYRSFSIRMNFSNKVINNYSVESALMFSLVLNYSIAVIGGIWALLLNFATNKPTGCFALAAAAFISMSIGGILNSGAIYKYSPVSLAQLGVVNGGIEEAYPTMQYVIGFYVVAFIVGLICLFVVAHARRDYSHFRV